MASRRNPPPNSANTNRQNEYFVPRDGIDREVITADICRYLGNDALVRPGTYQDDSGRPIQGYYITAYRNLTTAMIADLKNDSARWDQERRKHQAGTVRYTDSMTYDSSARHSNTGYDTSGYGNDVKYPGSDAPGYSAANMPGAAAYGQAQAQPWQQGYGYGSQPTQYSQADMRYAQQQQSMAGMGGMPMAATGYGAAQMPPEIYAGAPSTGAPYRVRGESHQASAHQYADTPMTDASMPPPPISAQPYPTSRAGQAAYGAYDQSQGSYYPAPSRSSGSYAAQPHDAFVGRKPASAQAAGTGPAGGGSPMAYEASETYDGTTRTPTTHTPTSRSAAATSGAQTQVPTSSSGTTSRSQRERTSERDHDRSERSERRERDRDQDDPSASNRTRKHRDAQHGRPSDRYGR